MNEKIQAFLKEYGELVKKHRVDFASYPQFIPDDEKGTFKVAVITQPVELPQDDILK